jgi:RHS repeat-associated protein
MTEAIAMKLTVLRHRFIVLASCLSSALAAPSAAALPSGPGSIDGFGSDYSSGAANGTATYAIPIEVPEGAGGLTPKIALEYEGGDGVSELGMGFGLGDLPRIRRRTENGLPKFDATDAFEIVGFGAPSDLKSIGEGFYRPEYEAGDFVRVQRGADTWEARDKSGIVYRFGAHGAVEAEGGRVATWLLTERIDLYGHRLAYSWDVTSGFALLTAITWNDYGPAIQCSVTVTYEARPDVHSLYSSGIKRVLAKRARAIDVTRGGALVRRYELAYAAAKISTLASVTMVGRDGVSRQPATTFEYTSLAIASSGTPVTMRAAPGVSLGVPSTTIADLNGDGLPDLLVGQAGAYREYINADGAAWGAGIDWGTASPSSTLNAAGVWLADINADGAADLTILDTSGLRYLPGGRGTRFGPAVASRTAPSVPTSSADTRMADIDGDQRSDFLTLSTTGLTVVYNLGATDWSAPQSLGPVDPAQTLAFSDGHTTLCDINGDLVEDICFLQSGSLRYWLGRGRGKFEPAQAAEGVPVFDPSSPWQLRDIDGDGWSDLVHVGVSRVDVALAKAAGKFDVPQSVTSTVTASPTTVVQFEDMNGSGTDDILWVDGAVAGQASWKYLELFPSGRGGLLRRVDNGRGLVRTFTYGTAAADAAAARAQGHAWSSRINVAMPVLRRIESDSSLGDPVEATELVYGDGAYSPEARTFAGFGVVVERRIGDASQPTLVTETRYDTGLVDPNLRGKPLRVEQRDEEGRVFAATETTYRTTSLDAGSGIKAKYSFASRQDVTSIEGADRSLGRTVRVEWEEDTFGNVTKESAWGEVRGDDVAFGNDERITLRTYANNVDDWLLGFPATEEIQDGKGNRVRLRRMYYDGAPFQGLPLGQVARGNVTREDAWLGPAPDAFAPVIGRAFDADGHVKETRDPLGGGRTLEWDPSDHTFVRAERRRVGAGTELVRLWVWDGAFGVVTSHTAWNGAVTATEHDPFGRVVAVIEPGDTHDRPTSKRAYVDAAPLSRIVGEARIRSGEDATERTEIVIDGAGRSRAMLTQLDDARWVASGRALYNAAGERRKVLRSAFVGEAERAAPPLQSDGPGIDAWRDARGRVVRTRTTMGRETRTAYAPLATRAWEPGQEGEGGPYEHTPVVFGEDGLGRLVERSETLAGAEVVARFSYDASGAVVARVDPSGARSQYAYDGLGRRTALDEPTVGKYAFAYDATGNLVERRRPDGSAQRFTYDLAGRLLSEDWDGDGKVDATQTWDVRPGRESDRNGVGELARAEDPSGSSTFEYDARARAVWTTQAIAGTTYRSGAAYDAQGRPVLRTFPDGSTLALTYDPRGLVTGFGDLARFEYDADGQEAKRSFQGGVTQIRGFDPDARLASEVATAPSGRVIQSLEWTYDEAGKLHAIADHRPGVDAAHDRSERYAYDNLHRLVHAEGTWGEARWTFSTTGNLLARASTVDALDTGPREYGAGGRPQALAASRGRKPTYDVLGRMIDDGDRRYAWNARDMAVSVESAGGGRVENVYDANEQRRARTEHRVDGSVHTTHFIDAWTEAEDGNLVRYLVKGGVRFARLGASAGGGAASSVAQAASRSTTQAASAGSLDRADALRGVSVLGFVLGALLLLRSGVRRAAGVRLAFGAAAFVLAAFGCSGEHGSDGDAGSISTFGADARLLFSDALGSLTEVTTTSGEPIGAFAAYPGGAVRYDTTSESRKYANCAFDSAVGVAAMGARLYAPDLGVWASVDPDGVEVPDRFVGAEFVEGNAYAYAGDDAANSTDESGHGRTKRGAKKKAPRATTPSAGAAEGGATTTTTTTERSSSKRMKEEAEEEAPRDGESAGDEGARPSVVYRVLRGDQDPSRGLHAKNPNATYSVDSHVGHGSKRKYKSQYISTTADLAVAQKWAHGKRIVMIDLSKVEGEIIDLTNPSVRNDRLKGATARIFAAASAEVLIVGHIPPEAISPMSGF